MIALINKKIELLFFQLVYKYLLLNSIIQVINFLYLHKIILLLKNI